MSTIGPCPRPRWIFSVCPDITRRVACEAASSRRRGGPGGRGSRCFEEAGGLGGVRGRCAPRGDRGGE
eukprot:3796848-Lingulodinium_polyedra.AAC.1